MALNSTINILSLSDIHLGHARTPASHIIANLTRMIRDDLQMAETDLCLLSGDVFDQLLTLPQDEVAEIRAWARHLLWLCEKHQVVLRVLEGTPRHDRHQSRIFEEIRQMCGFTTDFAYVETLHIEHFPQWDAHILYVPDEYHRDPMVTYREIRGLMQKLGIEQVDFASMHGAFEYQLPEISHEKHPPHRSELYLEMVRHLVFIGHVHQFSQHERIFANGSFDRLAHGEEEPKGLVRARVGPNHCDVTFVENTGAMVYKTLDVKGLDAAGVLAKIEEHIDAPLGSYFRLMALPGDAALVGLQLLREHYPQFTLTPGVKKVEEATTALVEAPVRKYVPRQLGPNNITELVLDWLERRGVEAWQVSKCEGIINERLLEATGGA